MHSSIKHFRQSKSSMSTHSFLPPHYVGILQTLTDEEINFDIFDRLWQLFIRFHQGQPLDETITIAVDIIKKILTFFSEETYHYYLSHEYHEAFNGIKNVMTFCSRISSLYSANICFVKQLALMRAEIPLVISHNISSPPSLASLHSFLSGVDYWYFHCMFDVDIVQKEYASRLIVSLLYNPRDRAMMKRMIPCIILYLVPTFEYICIMSRIQTVEEICETLGCLIHVFEELQKNVNNYRHLEKTLNPKSTCPTREENLCNNLHFFIIKINRILSEKNLMIIFCEKDGLNLVRFRDYKEKEKLRLSNRNNISYVLRKSTNRSISRHNRCLPMRRMFGSTLISSSNNDSPIDNSRLPDKITNLQEDTCQKTDSLVVDGQVSECSSIDIFNIFSESDITDILCNPDIQEFLGTDSS
jgi:hypothetical protein